MTNQANRQNFVFRAIIKGRFGEKQLHGWFGVESVSQPATNLQDERFDPGKMTYTIQYKKGKVVRKMSVEGEDIGQRHEVLFHDMYNAFHPLAPVAGQTAPVHSCSRIAPWAWKLIIDQYRPTEFSYWAMHPEDVRPGSATNSV